MASKPSGPRVTVVHSPAPREVVERILDLAPGATVMTALVECGMQAVEIATAAVGIWGRHAAPGTVLRDGDRIEVYRPLKVDPKLARRERFRKQGARAAGLFAGKREGRKAGY